MKITKNYLGDYVICYEMIKQIVEAIEYLKSLSVEDFKEIKEIVSVYNEGEDYCDFYYGTSESELIIEGCFCKNIDGIIELQPTFTVLNMEHGIVCEIED